ncbi:MAG: helix-turn-helix domain-containing protein [Pseudomonadota bacterium]
MAESRNRGSKRHSHNRRNKRIRGLGPAPRGKDVTGQYKTREPLLTESQVAARFGVSRDTVKRMRERGEIRYLTVGKRFVRYREEWLDEYEEGASCPRKTDPANSENTGSQSDPAPKTGIAHGMSEALPALDGQSAKVLALRTLKKQS